MCSFVETSGAATSVMSAPVSPTDSCFPSSPSKFLDQISALFKSGGFLIRFCIYFTEKKTVSFGETFPNMGGWGVWFRNRSKNPQIAFFGPNFTFRVPKSHPGMGGWVERFGKGTSPDLANGYELPARIWFDHNSHPIYSNPQELVKLKSVERWASSHNTSSISNWRSVSSFINISLIFSTVRAHLQSFLFLVSCTTHCIRSF